jgi:hypothetical protein
VLPAVRRIQFNERNLHKTEIIPLVVKATLPTAETPRGSSDVAAEQTIRRVGQLPHPSALTPLAALEGSRGAPGEPLPGDAHR